MEEYVAYCLDHIRAGLTGDAKKDMEYLHHCSEKYKNDEDATEILGEIAAMMYNLLDDDEKQAVNSRYESALSETAVKYESVKAMVKAGDMLAAKDLMDTVIASVEGTYQDTDTNIFLSFNHINEFYVYHYYFKPEKEVVATDVPFNEYYRTKGVILTFLEAYDQAKEALTESLRWNPVDLDTYLSLGEVYKRTGQLEEYLGVTKDVYRYCCTRATMARYYRNLGYYYLQKYQPELAGVLFKYSNIYYETDNATQEIGYVEQALGRPLEEMSVRQMQEVMTKAEIELGPDGDTIGIIYRVGEIMMENNSTAEARHCFSIVYDITAHKEVGELLDSLEKAA